jgi:hypothetical protein
MEFRLVFFIPVTGRGGPYVYETSRLPHFVDNRLKDDEIISLARRPRSTRQKHFLVLISVSD